LFAFLNNNNHNYSYVLIQIPYKIIFVHHQQQFNQQLLIKYLFLILHRQVHHLNILYVYHKHQFNQLQILLFNNNNLKFNLSQYKLFKPHKHNLHNICKYLQLLHNTFRLCKHQLLKIYNHRLFKHNQGFKQFKV
jgi:hypothetical protein